MMTKITTKQEKPLQFKSSKVWHPLLVGSVACQKSGDRYEMTPTGWKRIIPHSSQQPKTGV